MSLENSTERQGSVLGRVLGEFERVSPVIKGEKWR